MAEDKGINLQIQGENTGNPALDERNIDVNERDPQHINEHIKVTFEDIIAEPEPTTYSFDKVWVLSYKVFNSVNIWCYRILSLICAIPAMVLWGCNFACLSFCTVWCCRPCMKSFEIQLRFFQTIWTTLITAFCEPCYLAVGKIFYNIRITRENKPE
ncbi:caveolin-3-like isoform X1 [Lineus longissimus]|uniref:caveolin-3-like isoform X1 n=1 Tax=Lineus longissimus TaxID=88925 RepID=UPI002B4CACA8